MSKESNYSTPSDLWFLASIWYNEYYQYVEIYVTYMQPGWTFTDEPEYLVYPNMLSLATPNQSKSSVSTSCHKMLKHSHKILSNLQLDYLTVSGF